MSRVLIIAHAGPEHGFGHLARAGALAEEAQAQGFQVRVAGNIAADAGKLAGALFPSIEVTSTDAVEQFLGDVDVVHIDTYAKAPAEIYETGALISSMQDASFGIRQADLVIDANLGAETWFVGSDATALIGADYTILRRQVLRAADEGSATNAPPKVLVVLGGVDPGSSTEALIHALDTLPDDFSLTVVMPRGELPPSEFSHQITIVPLVEDLPRTAIEHDIVVSASGTSVWDFAHLGVPLALTCVVENQIAGYQSALGAGIAVGIGTPTDLDLLPFQVLLNDLEARTALGKHAKAVIDGHGAWRIVSTWTRMLQARTATVSDSSEASAPLTTRRATLDDADLLLNWRNAPATRAVSRSSDELVYEDHVAWLARTLQRTDRMLLVVEDDGAPVGTVRWDQLNQTDWEVSITVAPSPRARGTGSRVLHAGEAALLGRATSANIRMLATVHQANEPSLRLFARANYLPHRPAGPDGMATFAKWHTVSTEAAK